MAFTKAGYWEYFDLERPIMQKVNKNFRNLSLKLFSTAALLSSNNGTKTTAIIFFLTKPLPPLLISSSYS
jgi:hypothetical protein